MKLFFIVLFQILFLKNYLIFADETVKKNSVSTLALPQEFVLEFIRNLKNGTRYIHAETSEINIYTLDEVDEKSVIFENCMSAVKSLNNALGNDRFTIKFFNISSITHTIPRRQINVFIGKNWQCDRVIRNFANIKNYNFGGVYNYYCINDSTIIGIDIQNEIKPNQIKKYMVLNVLKLFGYNSFRVNHTLIRSFPTNNKNYHPHLIETFFDIDNNSLFDLTKLDKAMIEFSEKYLFDNSSYHSSTDKIIAENWPLFAMNFDRRNL